MLTWAAAAAATVVLAVFVRRRFLFIFWLAAPDVVQGQNHAKTICAVGELS